MSKPAAERCTTNHVHLHIARQRKLGERMIADHDRPRRLDLIVSGVAFATLVAVSAAYYFKLLPAFHLAGCFA